MLAEVAIAASLASTPVYPPCGPLTVPGTVCVWQPVASAFLIQGFTPDGTGYVTAEDGSAAIFAVGAILIDPPLPGPITGQLTISSPDGVRFGLIWRLASQ
jgi:hypothetical protein